MLSGFCVSALFCAAHSLKRGMSFELLSFALPVIGRSVARNLKS